MPPGNHIAFPETLLNPISLFNFTTLVVRSLSRVRLFVTPWTAAQQASQSFTISLSSLKLMSIQSVMPSNHLILCHPLLLLPSILPSNTVFSNELALTTSVQAIKLTKQAETMQSDLNNQWRKLQLFHDLQKFLSKYWNSIIYKCVGKKNKTIYI